MFRIYRVCRSEELANMAVSDIDDKGSLIIVIILKSNIYKKTYKVCLLLLMILYSYIKNIVSEKSASWSFYSYGIKNPYTICIMEKRM